MHFGITEKLRTHCVRRIAIYITLYSLISEVYEKYPSAKTLKIAVLDNPTVV